MNTLSPIELAALGFLVGAVLGLIGVMIGRATMHRARRRHARPPSIACLICGRRSRVTQEEWHRSKMTCRCGQTLYLASPSTRHEHPHRL